VAFYLVAFYLGVAGGPTRADLSEGFAYANTPNASLPDPLGPELDSALKASTPCSWPTVDVAPQLPKPK